MTDEQVDSHGQSNRTRRGLLRGLGVTAGTTLLAAGVANRLADPVAAADVSAFSAADTPTVEDNDGEVTAVYVAPEIDIWWENFSEGVTEVTVTLEATVDLQTDVIYEVTLTEVNDDGDSQVESADGGATEGFSATDGSFGIELIEEDITNVGNDITANDFSDGTLDAGESTATTVDLELDVVVQGGQGEEASRTISDTFEVEVENPDGETTVDGDANTDAE